MDPTELIRSHGATVDDLVDAAFELYVGDTRGDSVEELRRRFRALLEQNMRDPNIALLLEAASHLDGVLGANQDKVFPGSEDPEALVADELIGMSIAEYIGGKRALFNYIRYDKAKPGVLAKLPPFMDDALGALVAATMTRLFEG
jgi:alpha-ribazole phosphatase CobZ